MPRFLVRTRRHLVADLTLDQATRLVRRCEAHGVAARLWPY